MMMNVMQILNSDDKKHLHELLTQDQEPFHLHNYIADRRSLLLTNKKTTCSANKFTKSNTKTTHSSRSCFYKQACFSSYQQNYSPDIINTNSPIYNNSSVFHVSPKTATQLVQAATKIHKQSSKTKHKYPGLVLFSSILKKLKDKHKTDKFANNIKENYHENHNNCSSAGWSEDDDEEEEDNKFKETISSSSSSSSSSCSTTTRSDFNNQDIISFVLPCSSDDQRHLCLSPLSSPFRFALHTSPSSTSRPTPEFISPEASPCQHTKQENIDDQACVELRKDELEEENEKEQCSPVSVLDLPFEDDEQDGKEDEYDYDLERSYAIMQKSKLQLLERLRRFERLAELEPIELEKRMLEGYDNDEDSDDDYLDDENEGREEVDDQSGLNADSVIGIVFSGTSPRHVEEVPGHMKRLVVDLVAEEKKKGMNNRNEVIAKMMCKRLDSWKQVASNTVEKMVEMDIRREFNRWDSYEEEIADRAKEIEVAIFSSLVDEISEELASH